MSLEGKKRKVIAAIELLSEDKLASLEVFINEISDKSNEYSIDFIYNKAVKKLAQ